jgi:hypothetical protein
VLLRFFVVVLSRLERADIVFLEIMTEADSALITVSEIALVNFTLLVVVSVVSWNAAY